MLAMLLALYEARVPLRIRKAITDFIAGVAVGLVGYTIIFPAADQTSWREFLVANASGIGMIVYNAARRAIVGAIKGS